MKPIFLLSLPRSGSTLLQRIISSHSKIKTESEPWILLPMLYALHNSGIVAEYNQDSLSTAINDFIDTLPNKMEDYYECVHNFTSSLYNKQTNNTRADYFLDKTPRYCLITNEIIKLFPDAKFIVLWRNPISILSSRFHSYGNKWRIYNYKVDLYKGLENLVSFSEKHKNSICQINYELLLLQPEQQLTRIFSYLELNMDQSVLDNFSSLELQGNLGDKTGLNEYSNLNRTPLDKYKDTLCNPLRIWWCKRYIMWIGKHRLQIMGYNYSELMHELDNIDFNLKHLSSDTLRHFYGILDEIFELQLIKKKLSLIKSGQRLFIHR